LSMAVNSVLCPGCSIRLRLPATMPSGKRIRCPKCQSAFSLSTALAAMERNDDRSHSDEQSVLSVFAEEMAADDYEEPSPRPRRPGRKKQSNLGWILGLSIGGVVIVGGFAVAMWLALRSAGGGAQETPQPEVAPEASPGPIMPPILPRSPGTK
jgi:hypothetical protein